MFNGVFILIAMFLGLLDLFILIRAAAGFGIVIILITQAGSAIFGLFRLRSMDFNLFFFLDTELKKGETIVKELWDEALQLLAVCLLVFPGFISDFIGLILLFPMIRNYVLEFTEVFEKNAK